MGTPWWEWFTIGFLYGAVATLILYMSCFQPQDIKEERKKQLKWLLKYRRWNYGKKSKDPLTKE